MTNTEIKAEAKNVLNAYDRGELAPYCTERRAAAIAGYWLDFQFARVDCECDWSDAKCERMHKRMVAALKDLGLN